MIGVENKLLLIKDELTQENKRLKKNNSELIELIAKNTNKVTIKNTEYINIVESIDIKKIEVQELLI